MRGCNNLPPDWWDDRDGKQMLPSTFMAAGKAIWGKTPDAALATMGVPPDFRCQIRRNGQRRAAPDRAAGDMDIYFVASGSPQVVDAAVRLPR